MLKTFVFCCLCVLFCDFYRLSGSVRLCLSTFDTTRYSGAISHIMHAVGNETMCSTLFDRQRWHLCLAPCGRLTLDPTNSSFSRGIHRLFLTEEWTHRQCVTTATDQHKFVLCLSSFKGCLSPGPPIHRIVSVLKQVWAGFVYQAVGHERGLKFEVSSFRFQEAN